jgi:hypothetical protein
MSVRAPSGQVRLAPGGYRSALQRLVDVGQTSNEILLQSLEAHVVRSRTRDQDVVVSRQSHSRLEASQGLFQPASDPVPDHCTAKFLRHSEPEPRAGFNAAIRAWMFAAAFGFNHERARGPPHASAKSEKIFPSLERDHAHVLQPVPAWDLPPALRFAAST